MRQSLRLAVLCDERWWCNWIGSQVQTAKGQGSSATQVSESTEFARKATINSFHKISSLAQSLYLVSTNLKAKIICILCRNVIKIGCDNRLQRLENENLS